MFAAGIPDQFWLDLLNATCPPEDEYKIALYLKADAADVNLSSTVYTTDGELESKGGYTRGGKVLTGRTVGALEKGAYLDFDDPTWGKVDFTADAAVIYNASKGNKILAIFGFGLTGGVNCTFSLTLPPPGPAAVIAIG